MLLVGIRTCLTEDFKLIVLGVGFNIAPALNGQHIVGGNAVIEHDAAVHLEHLSGFGKIAIRELGVGASGEQREGGQDDEDDEGRHGRVSLGSGGE